MSEKDLEYPDNLLADLEISVMSNDTEDIKKGIEYAIVQLPPKYQLIINSRYKNGDTYTAIAKELGVSAQRVPFLRKKALKILRRRENLDYIQFGYDRAMEINKMKENADSIRNMDINELNLCTRIYNCLRRENLDTVGEVADFIRANHPFWRGIRSMGSRGAEEIVDALKDLNVVAGSALEPIVLLPEESAKRKKEKRIENKYLDYPYNLLADLEISTMSDDAADIEKGVEYAIGQLPVNYQFVIHGRYKNKNAFDTIGIDLGITGRQVSNICKKALQLLRLPYSSDYMRFGFDKNSAMLKVKEEESVCKEMARYGNTENAAFIRKTDINELDLSNRTCNCLKREKLDTVGAIADFMRKHKHFWCSRIHNMDSRGAEEVFNALKDLNVVDGSALDPIVLLPEENVETSSKPEIYNREDSIFENIGKMSQYQFAKWLMEARMEIFVKCVDLDGTLSFLDEKFV